MKLVCISDTHLAEPDLPDGDILIHAGDLTYKGTAEQIGQQRYWLAKQRKRYKHVVIIPGNHDFGFEDNYGLYKKEFEKSDLIVLNDSGITLDGINFYGSPITPWFHNWAFNRYSHEIERHWDMIWENTNVLITHGLPHGILDGIPRYNKKLIGHDKYYQPMYAKSYEGTEHVGCPYLLERVKQLKQLKLHIGGHIHESYGQHSENGVDFINAAIMNADYQAVNRPIVYDLQI